MRKTLLFPAIIILVFLIGCGKDKDRYEPNNSFEQAKKIKLNRVISLSIYPEKDIDFFKFKVKKAGIFKAELDTIAFPGLNLSASIFNDEKGIILKDEKIPFSKTMRKGEYFISIKDESDRFEEKKLFNINFIFQEVTLDKFEPNDSISDAKKIKLNNDAEINIFPAGDREFFKIQSPGTGYFRINCSDEKPKEMKLIAEFYNQAEEKYYKPVSIPCEIPVPKESFSFLIYEKQNNEAADLFDFKVEFSLVVLDEFEPNNTMFESKKIEIGKPFRINFFPLDDKDWFNFIVNDNCVIEILKEFEKDKKRIDIKVSLFDSQGNVVVNNKSIPFKVALASGKYSLQLSFADKNLFYHDKIMITINQIK